MKFPLKITMKNKKNKIVEKGASGSGQIPEVITIWSPQATGKSVLAGSLASAFAQQMPEKRICLVDFDMYTPAFSSEMDLNKTAEAIFRGDYDPEHIAESITKVKGFKNLYCLGGLTEILSMDLFTQDNIKSLLDVFSRKYDHLVIDTGREINLTSTLVAFYTAGKVLMPVVGKVDPLRHARRYLDILENGLKLEKDKITVVVNKYDRQVDGFSVKEVEELLGRPVSSLKYNAKLTGEGYFPKSFDRGVSEKLLSLAAIVRVDNEPVIENNESAKGTDSKLKVKAIERADNLGSC